MYQSWLATSEPDDLIQGPGEWDVLTAEPGGVDYLETDAGGVSAMWEVPKGCAQDRVLLCIHGGGFMSGSMYTHRKLFGHLAKAVGARALNVGYRILPEGVHPVPVDDVIAAYRWLLDQGIDPERVASIRSTPTSPVWDPSTSKWATTSCCSMTVAGWPNGPERPGWRSSSTSFRNSSTPSR
jgi:alpha/beta hydrolase fold